MNTENTFQDSWAAPALDIYESEDGYVAVADLPGVNKQGLALRYEKGRLFIEGARAAGPTWKRAIEVPDTVDVERIEAGLEAGVLEIKLPKSDARKARQIPIRAS